MTALPPAAQRAQARLRDRAEMHLRLAAMDDLRRAHPDVTSAPRRPPGGAFWRYVFVPLYRRVPWEQKERAMHALGMTAESHGWTPPAREPSEPWRPPAVPPPGATSPSAASSAASDPSPGS